MNKINNYLILLICFSVPNLCFAQQKDSALYASHITDSSLSALQGLPSKYYSKVDKKISGINDHLTKKSLKYLAKFQRQEQKLQQRLQKLHPELAVTDATEKYNELSQKIKSKTSGITKVVSGEYNPYMDSLGTSLSFLKQFNGISDKVNNPLKSFELLQGNLQESEKVKAFIAERKNQIKELLSKYTHLPAGLKNEYSKLSKTAYYYSAQVKEYKEMLKDPDKIERKTFYILSHTKMFQDFMKKNSVFASLFRMPAENPNDPAYLQSLAGLQTREEMNQLIQNQISSGGPNAMSVIQANFQQAQNQLQQLKNKMTQYGNRATDADMPDFKPNNQKAKSFLGRLEYGTNIQTQKSNSLFPVTTDMGLSVGYKLNDKSIIGIGASYKLGWGKNIQHVDLTSQGAGLRSYIDYKIKKSLWLSGGYEMNYLSAFNNLEQLRGLGAWKKSGLAGISKKLPIKTKFFKNTKMQLFWDFLSYQQVPRTQPVIFRMGYNIK